MTTFGERIRELRTTRDNRISLRDLARRVEIDFTYLSKIENGKVPPPSDEVIEKLARELEADLEELLALAAKVSQEDLRKAVAQDPRVGVLFRKLQSRDLTKEQLEQILEIAVPSEKDDATDMVGDDRPTILVGEPAVRFRAWWEKKAEVYRC